MKEFFQTQQSKIQEKADVICLGRKNQLHVQNRVTDWEI